MRRIEAWAGVYSDGSFALANDKKHLKGGHWKVVRLVEHSPAKEAVVRAARKLTDAFCRANPEEDEMTELCSAVAIAVAKYERARGRR